jgi:hypothetical protein
MYPNIPKTQRIAGRGNNRLTNPAGNALPLAWPVISVESFELHFGEPNEHGRGEHAPAAKASQ